jgi:hypothetical protein
MEVLQAVSYTVVNQCGNPLNQILTLFGYLHHLPALFHQCRRAVFHAKDAAGSCAFRLYRACFIGAICMLEIFSSIRSLGRVLRGSLLMWKLLCTVRGEWHLAWLVPTNGIGNNLRVVGLGMAIPLISSAFACRLSAELAFHLVFLSRGPFASEPRHQYQ